MNQSIIGLCVITQKNIVYKRLGIEEKENELLGAVCLLGMFGVIFMFTSLAAV